MRLATWPGTSRRIVIGRLPTRAVEGRGPIERRRVGSAAADQLDQRHQVRRVEGVCRPDSARAGSGRPAGRSATDPRCSTRRSHRARAPAPCARTAPVWPPDSRARSPARTGRRATASAGSPWKRRRRRSGRSARPSRISAGQALRDEVAHAALGARGRVVAPRPARPCARNSAAQLAPIVPAPITATRSTFSGGAAAMVSADIRRCRRRRSPGRRPAGPHRSRGRGSCWRCPARSPCASSRPSRPARRAWPRR